MSRYAGIKKIMAGRPEKTFTEQQIAAIERYSAANCNIDTIAMALSIAKSTLIRHFGTFIKQKRAEYRAELSSAQHDKAIEGKDTTMLKWLGQQHLDQTDKQEIKTEVEEKRALTEMEKAEAVRLAGIRLRQA